MNRALPHTAVERAVAFANQLFLFGHSTAPLAPDFVALSDSRGNTARQQVTAIKTFSRRGPQSTTEGGEYGFAIALNLNDLLALRIPDTEITVCVEGVGRPLGENAVSVSLAPMEGSDPEFVAAYLGLAAQLELLDKRLVDFLNRGGADAPQSLSYAIDLAGRSNSGFVVEGWIANGRAENCAFLSADGLVFITGSEVIYKARPDVSQHLRAQKQSVLTDDHGVLLSFPHTLGATDSFIALREYPDGFAAVARIKANLTGPRDRLLELVAFAVGGGKFPRPAQARKFYLPFFVDTKNSEEFSVNWLTPTKPDVTTSIIIPMFREYRFIFSLLAMQARFSDAYEWLFVSDDPVQHQILARILERRSQSLRGPTALITNRFNYGYGASNNIGASVANGKTLLFMNSDIWVESAKPVDQAERILRDGAYQTMGFRLLYEDGSVQHDGISFRPYNLMHNLLLADHPGKGTPPGDNVDRVMEVPAVTGALLMIRKEIFLRAGAFDRAYIKGDFEDADLCLKVRAGGGKIGLYKTNELFHLERQSIRLMGDDSARMALTYLNCITFNERWGRFLTQPQAPRRDQRPRVAEARQKKALAG
jgi:GT2 family glycosyltransferase